MKVILKENIDNLGRKGDIVDIAPGYGRNFLIPKKLALEVIPSNMKMIEMEQLALRKKFDQEKSTYQDFIDRLKETRLTFIRKTAEKDVIFGSVSSADIREALSEQGLDVDKKKVLLDEPIKRLGNYTVPIKVFHDERAEVKIEVVTEEAIVKEEKEIPKEEIKEMTEEVVEGAGKEEPPDKETAETVLGEPMEGKKEDTKETAETVVMDSEEEKKEREEERQEEPPEEKLEEAEKKEEETEEVDTEAPNEEKTK